MASPATTQIVREGDRSPATLESRRRGATRHRCIMSLIRLTRTPATRTGNHPRIFSSSFFVARMPSGSLILLPSYSMPTKL